MRFTHHLIPRLCMARRRQLRRSDDRDLPARDPADAVLFNDHLASWESAIAD